MKRHILFAAALLFLFCTLMAACGVKEEGTTEEKENSYGWDWQGIAPGLASLNDITERTEYYDITLESESFRSNAGGRAVGTQFFQGEPIQLWLEGTDIYLHGTDKSSELLLQNVPQKYVTLGVPTEEFESGKYTQYSCQWYMDQEGNYYCYGDISEQNGQYSSTEGLLVKFLSTGEILYENTIGSDILVKGLCQTEDGKVYLLLNDRTEDDFLGKWLVAEIEPSTGKLVQENVWELPFKYEVFLGKTGSFPAAVGYTNSADERQIALVDMAKGSLSPILFFNGTSYGWHTNSDLMDFQISADGELQLLWTTGLNRSEGLWEKLRMEKVDKIPIVVRGIFNGDTWFANKVAQFNMKSSTYHVVVEDCGNDNDQEDFARLTSIQIGAKQGPDIINGALMSSYVEGMLEKGALEALNSYMEAAGIQEEDYLPLAFASWRQGEQIYAVDPLISVWDIEMAEEVLGDCETPDIETLVDALLAWEGGGVYCKGYDSAEVLEMFLKGTESLWGMVDWENGSCDFNTPLFGKLLEAAKQYGDDGRKNSDSIMELRSYWNIAWWDGQAERESKGKVVSGVLFDDGCYAVSSSSYALAMNANSSNKEGAWEFMRFLLGKEAQTTDSTFTPPTQRTAFEAYMQKCIQKANSPTIPYDTSEVKQEEYIKKIEEARPLPLRTTSILEIILDEASYYFNGYKSVEQVSQVINNRVQLYLDE